MRRATSCYLFTLVLPLLALPPLRAADEVDDTAEAGSNKAVDSPESALRKFSVAPGLQIDVWAAEPLIANVVAFSFDNRGRAFVAETYRRRTSAPDIRRHGDWLIPDLALRTVEEREAMMKKMLAPELQLKIGKDHVDMNNDGQFDWRDWAVESERVKLVEDRAGKGVADTASVFADGFNTLLTGTAAGVLVYGDSVWYTAIPDLWKLDGASHTSATAKNKLLSGFGVHVAFGGHDMHGPKMGPDGRVYWTVADCGSHVKTKEGTFLDLPDMGAVFRANPDGSDAEIFAQGLRNPQSLAFNDVGDLFTGDNNADGGDKARWEHVVEAGDYGWRIGWQFLPKLGAWNSEKLWERDTGSTALSQLPPTGLLGHGPAGVAYYPGTGLPVAFQDHFFMADFPGGVRSFTLKPNGASYLVNLSPELQLDNKPSNLEGKLVWGLYPSDVQFGVDGGAYVLDWVIGWEKTGKGRIYRLHDPATDASAPVQRTKKLLAEGMGKRPEAELIALLSEPDQRVRQAAQFALATKGESSLPALTTLAGNAKAGVIARLHGIWALGQIGRAGQPRAFASLAALLSDREAEVRAQAAKILGESRQSANGGRLLPLLKDPESRVRFFAAQALGDLKYGAATPALVDFLRAGVGTDAYLRHAAALALSRCADTAALTALVRDSSDTVRTGVLVALRRQHSPEVAAFLQDGNPQLVLEAARAIHDEPIAAAMPVLAGWAAQAQLPAPLARRAINAAYRIGTVESATALATLAANEQAPALNRADALEALGQWTTDLGRDRLLGTYRPLPTTRITKAGAEALAPRMAALLGEKDETIRIGAVKAVSALLPVGAEPVLATLALDEKAPPTARAAALGGLDKLSSPHFAEAIAAAVQSSDPALRREAKRLASSHLSEKDLLKSALASLQGKKPGDLASAFEALGPLPEPEAGAALATWMEKLATGKVPAAVQLELLEAAGKSPDGKVKQELAAYEKKRAAAGDPTARYSECLEGGDAKLGQQVFAEKAEVACMRCHKWKGEGGDVGPDLAGLAAKHDRVYLLRSIVSPNADIAPGYENVLLTLKNGGVVVGILAAQDATSVTIKPLTGGDKVVVKIADVKQRDQVPSPMPEGLADSLGKRDLRNIVAFLASGK